MLKQRAMLPFDIPAVLPKPETPKPETPKPEPKPKAAPPPKPDAHSMVQASIDAALSSAPTPSASAPPAPTTLHTEVVGDGQANCLENAATQAKPERDNIVFLDDTRAVGEGNGNDAGHTLIEDRTSGRVWDPNDGTPPEETSDWPHDNVDSWLADAPEYEVSASVPAEQVQAVLAAPPEDRAGVIAATGNEDLARIADQRFADIDPQPFEVFLSDHVQSERLDQIDDAFEDIGSPAYVEDVTSFLSGDTELGDLSDDETTRVLDHAVNSWRGTTNYDAIRELGRWAVDNPEHQDFIAADFAARSLEFQTVAGENPGAGIATALSSTLAVESMNVAGDREGRRALIDDLGEESGLLFMAINQPIPEGSTDAATIVYGPSATEVERLDASALMLQAAAGGEPTTGSSVTVATAMAVLDADDFERSQDGAEWRPRTTPSLEYAFSQALAKHTYPDQPHGRHWDAIRTQQILGTDTGRELLFGNDRPLNARVQALDLIRQHPEWGTDIDIRTFEQAAANQVATPYLDLRGDTPVELSGTDLENTVGYAFGFEPDSVPSELSPSDLDERERRIAEGRLSMYQSDPAAEQIAPVVERIREVGGDDPEVTVLPVRYHDDNGQAVDLTLFRVQDEATGEDRFVDNIGRKYPSFDDWLQDNQLPSGRMIYPPDGHLAADSDGEVVLEEDATPKTIDTNRERLTQFLDNAALVGGTIAGVAITFGTGGTAAPFVLAGAGAWTAYRIGDEAHDRLEHGQSLNPFEDPDARRLWLDGGALALTAVTLGASRVATFGPTVTRTNRVGAATARVFGTSAFLVDGGAAANVGYELINNWDELDGGTRATMMLSLGFWSSGAGASGRSAARPFPRVDDAWRPNNTWGDADFFDAFVRRAPDDARTGLNGVTPAELRAVFPEGGAYPAALDSAAGLPGFANVLGTDPNAARTLVDATALYGPQVGNHVRQHGIWDAVRVYESSIPTVRPHPDNADFSVVERGVGSPSWLPEIDLRLRPDADHNGAFQQYGPVDGAQGWQASNLPSTTNIRPQDVWVDGTPRTDMDGVMVFSAHGSTRGFGELTTPDAANLVADEIVIAQQNGVPIDEVLLNACNQRNCRLDGRSNAQDFQAELNEALEARGMSPVTVLAAERGGLTYNGTQRNIAGDVLPGVYHPAADGPRVTPTGEQLLWTLFGGSAAVGLGYGGGVIYTEVTDD